MKNLIIGVVLGVSLGYLASVYKTRYDRGFEDGFKDGYCGEAVACTPPKLYKPSKDGYPNPYSASFLDYDGGYKAGHLRGYMVQRGEYLESIGRP